MERNKKVEFILIGLLVLQAVASVLLFPKLPDRIPTHWDINGQVNGWMSRVGSIMVFSGTSLGLYLLLLAVPYLDPKKKIAARQKAYNAIRVALQVLLLLTFAFSMAAAFELTLPIDRLLPAALAIMFIILGNYLGKIRPNYFMGIRTPWTLEDPVVWQKTHRAGGPVFMLAGLVGLIGCFWGGKTGFLLLIGPIMAGAVFLTGYSWFQFKRLHPKHQDG